MARKLRVQYPGAMYHVMNRGDRREAIFTDEEDRKRFLETLGQACEKTWWQVHAYRWTAEVILPGCFSTEPPLSPTTANLCWDLS